MKDYSFFEERDKVIEIINKNKVSVYFDEYLMKLITKQNTSGALENCDYWCYDGHFIWYGKGKSDLGKRYEFIGYL